MKRWMTLVLAGLLVLPGVRVMAGQVAADQVAAEQVMAAQVAADQIAADQVMAAQVAAKQVAAGSGNPALDAAFEADKLVLTPAVPPDVSPADFEFTDEMLELGGYDNQEDLYAALEQAMPLMHFNVCSLSPAGNSGFLALDDMMIAFYEGKYHILYPSFSQSVADEYENLAKYADMAMNRMPQLLGTDGVIYSVDGRYAVICNHRFVLTFMNLFIDPILIDLSTGAMILTATYPNKIMTDEAGAVTTACFSSDNRYFYYYLYGRIGDTNSILCRYDLQAGETQICYSGTENLFYPRLSETAEGDLLILQDVMDPGLSMAIAQLTEEQDGWTAVRHPFDLSMKYWRTERLLYSADSGYAVLPGGPMPKDGFDYGFQCFRPEEEWEGMNRYLVISREEDRILSLDANEMAAAVDAAAEEAKAAEAAETSQRIMQLPFHMIIHAALSPDGQYLLLLTKDEQCHLYMVRLQDLQMREVTGFDPADIPLDPNLRKYNPGIEWNTDTLIIGTKDGVTAWRFEGA